MRFGGLVLDGYLFGEGGRYCVGGLLQTWVCLIYESSWALQCELQAEVLVLQVATIAAAVGIGSAAVVVALVAALQTKAAKAMIQPNSLRNLAFQMVGFRTPTH